MRRVEQNIRFAYMYRDGSNYKFHEEIVLSNPDRLSVKAIDAKIVIILGDTSTFADTLLFRPEWIGLPTAFPFTQYGRNADDHDWHEIVLIEASDDAADDPRGRSIEQLLSDLERAHVKPIERA